MKKLSLCLMETSRGILVVSEIFSNFEFRGVAGSWRVLVLAFGAIVWLRGYEFVG